MTESILFMGHGSRDAQAVDECMSMVSDLERRLGQSFTPGFLELSEPLLFPEIVRQIDRGVRRFLCFPNMLLPGRHTMEHLPGVIGWAQRHFPEVEFYYGNFIGNHPLIHDILRRNHRRALRRSSTPGGSERTITVIVGRGSRSRRSNRTFEKIVRRFGRREGLEDLRYGYVSLAEPGLRRVLRGLMREVGVGRVVLLPYFLFTGVLMKRIEALRSRFARRHPDVEFVLGEYFGRDERLRDILRGRIRDLIERPRNHRSNDFTAISEQAAHHLHHLDVFGDEPAADYLQQIPDCPEHRHPSSRMEQYAHLHDDAGHLDETP